MAKKLKTHPASFKFKVVLPLSMVDNSDSSPNRLTILIDPVYPSF